MPYLVDGNNLLGTIAGKKVEDANSREELMKLMFRYSRSAGNKIDLVFDGPPHGGLRENMHYGSVQVLFSGSNCDADTLILNRVRNSSRPHEITVVSSDSTVFQRARSLGATSIQSRHFYKQVQDYLAIANESYNDISKSVNDISDWMNYFGYTDDGEITDE